MPTAMLMSRRQRLQGPIIGSRRHEMDLIRDTYAVHEHAGYTVLPPFVAYRVDRLDETGFVKIADQLRERMRSIETTEQIRRRTAELSRKLSQCFGPLS